MYEAVEPARRPTKRRRGARVLLRCQGRVLLISDCDPGVAGSQWWVLPGGGIDAAALRSGSLGLGGRSGGALGHRGRGHIGTVRSSLRPGRKAGQTQCQAKQQRAGTT